MHVGGTADIPEFASADSDAWRDSGKRGGLPPAAVARVSHLASNGRGRTMRGFPTLSAALPLAIVGCALRRGPEVDLRALHYGPTPQAPGQGTWYGAVSREVVRSAIGNDALVQCERAVRRGDAAFCTTWITDCITVSYSDDRGFLAMLHPPAFCGGTPDGNQQWGMCKTRAPAMPSDDCTLVQFP